MTVTTKTTVTFQIPEEHELARRFVAAHDMSEWRESVSSNFIGYTQQRTFAVDMRGEQE